METNRTQLDALLAASNQALLDRDALESCFTPEWKAAHQKAHSLCLAVSAERKRLWKTARWGTWMTKHDRALATISGEI